LVSIYRSKRCTSKVSKLQEVWGGECSNRGKLQDHQRWRWRLRIIHAKDNPIIVRVVKVLAANSILKARQALLLLEYSKGIVSMKETKQLLAALFSEIGTFDFSGFDDRLTDMYSAGLFDADGCIRNDSLRITQKACPCMLNMLRQKYGGAIVDSSGEWTVYSKEVIFGILKIWYDALVVKFPQVVRWIDYYDGTVDRTTLNNELSVLKRI
jgi:hypothetical protein